MLTTEQLGQFKARIEMELSGLLEWVEAPEIRGTEKEKILRRQRQLEAAFLRIQQGVFGVCCDCGDMLTLLEMENDPAAPFCSYCQKERKAVPS